MHSLNICQCVPKKECPISGNGQVDLWVEARLWLGFHNAAFRSYMDEIDEAFVSLEDTVSLLEKAVAIRKKELSTSSPWLENITWTAEEDFVDADFSGLYDKGTLERIIRIHDGEGCYVIYPSVYYGFITAEADDKWYTRYSFCFDKIRNDPRYLDCVKRVKALIRTKEA